ncbi:MAG TPA: PDR/VanB family oxidoreductase [Burkholderiales bacterium]|nr:PDR/VanB family oxidoreductase [Burkholderiales bacterium]
MSASISVRVGAISEVVPGIKEFSLSRPDGAPLPSYSGGSHVLVTLPGASRAHRNSYSLMGDPSRTDAYRIAVRRHAGSRGGSRVLHEQVEVGTPLTISHPLNLFPIARLGRKHILVAGGIGVTPIIAQAHDLARRGADFEVHYAFRAPDQAAYADVLRDLAGTRLHRYCTASGERIDFRGMLADQPIGTHLYVCGPVNFIDAARSAARAHRWPSSHIHSEQFLSPPVGSAFEVHLARSGRRIAVAPDISLLEAIEQAGVAAPQSCRGGACGQCETEVMEADGQIAHHDVYLSEADKAAGRKIMLCVSRLQGRRLVLNL